MRRLSIIVWSALIAACVTIPTPKPQPPNPPAVVLSDPTFPQQCRDIAQQELGRAWEDSAVAACVEQFKHGVSGEAIRQPVHDSQL